jgi:hypothetical protein
VLQLYVVPLFYVLVFGFPLPLISLNFLPPPALALAVPAHDFQHVGLIPKPASSLIGGSDAGPGFIFLGSVFILLRPVGI